MISKKFLRNSIIYTIAGALPMASALILLPVYLTYLSAPVYGAVILYMGFALFVQIFVTYSFDASIYNYFHDYKNDKEKLSVFVSSVFSFILLVGLATSVVLLFLGNWIFEKVYSDSAIAFYPYGVISVVSGVFQAVFKVNSSLMQTQEKAVSFLLNNVISFSLIAGLTVLGLYFFPDKLIGPLVGRLLAVVISGGWVLGTIYYQFGFHFNFKLIKSTFGFAHPSLLYQIMQWFNNSYDRVVLSNFLPLAQVGIYDLAAKCLSAIELALGGFYSSFFPKVVGIVAMQTKKKTTTEINRYFNGLTAVTILLVCFSILLFPPVIRLLSFKPGFLSAIEWIPFIAVTYLLRSLRYYLAMPYGTTKYSKPLPFFYVVIAASKIAGMIFLIPRYGIMGLIMATWIGYLVEVLTLYFGIKDKFEISFNAYKLIIAPLVLVVIIIIVEPLFGKEYEVLSHLLYVGIGGLVLAFAYRNEMKVFDWASFPKFIKKG